MSPPPPPPPPAQELGQLIVAVVASEAVASAAVVTVASTTITVAQVVGTIALVAVNAALSFALAPGGGKLEPQNAQQNLRQSIPARRRYYGRVKVGGAYMLYESKDGLAYNVLAICDGPIDAFEEFWLGDRNVALDGGDNHVTSYPYVTDEVPRVYIYPQTGSAAQTAHSRLTTDLPTVWTSNHRLRGIANVAMACVSTIPQQFLLVYPKGLPTVRVVARAAKVFDQRDVAQDPGDATTWEWSENAILATQDFLTHADGYGFSRDLIDDTSWIAAANIADEDIPLKAGGTEKRYKISGGYSFDEPRRDTLRRMLPCADASLYITPAGKIGIHAGKWSAPTVTLSQNSGHITGYNLQQGSGKLRAANTIRAKYVSPLHDYQAVDAEAWIDATDVALRGELEQSIDLTMVPQFGQCRRLMKVAAARANPRWTGTINTTLKGFEALNERVITVQIAELGVDETFEVLKVDLDISTLTAQIAIQSLDATAYAWDAATEEGTAPPIPAPSEESSEPIPANLTATVVTKNLGGGVTAPALQISCDAPARNDLILTVEYQLEGETDWIQIAAPYQSFSVETPPLAVGLYDVRARFSASGYGFSYTSILQDVVVANSTSAPSAPVSFSATLDTGVVTLTATSPNHANHRALRFWRNSTNNFATATDITGAIYTAANVVTTRTNTPGSGTWYYWATSEFDAATRSTPAGPQSVGGTYVPSLKFSDKRNSMYLGTRR